MPVNRYLKALNWMIAVLVGIAIPLSTSLENIALVLIPPTVIINRNCHLALRRAFNQLPIIMGLILYAFYLVGTTWSSAPLVEIKHMLIKMLGLVVLPFAYAFFSYERHRRIALYSYFIAIGLTLILSFGSWLFKHPVLHGAVWIDPLEANNWCPFRAHAYHCYFMGLTGVLVLDKLLRQQLTNRYLKYAAWLWVVLVTINIYYLVASRTGQLAYLMMLVITLCMWQWKRGSLLALGLVLMVPLVVVTSPAVQHKLVQAQIDLANSAKGNNVGNSLGLRATFHHYARMLIAEKPLFGHGTGSYSHEYQRVAIDDQINQDGNPHGDFLWVGVELGWIGIIIFSGFLVSCAAAARKLTSSYRTFGFMLPVTYAIICSQNSFFTDSVSGIAYILLFAYILSSQPQSSYSRSLA